MVLVTAQSTLKSGLQVKYCQLKGKGPCWRGGQPLWGPHWKSDNDRLPQAQLPKENQF